jgi:hypothetical protein
MVPQEISPADVAGMYVGEGMSLTDINHSTGLSVSTARRWLHQLSMLRGRADAVRMAAADGKLSGRAGIPRPPRGDQWRARISAAALARGEASAKGASLKPSGYIEITRGPNKGRLQHVVVMEELLGRPLLPDECVHHKDENRSNNSPDNLELMTRAEHARLHALENHVNRKRKENGQFE